jgi:hypothetical protein
MYQIAQFYRRFPVEIVIYSAWLYSTLPQTFDLLTALLTHYCQVERTWQGEVGIWDNVLLADSTILPLQAIYLLPASEYRACDAPTIGKLRELTGIQMLASSHCLLLFRGKVSFGITSQLT